jgi:hypothetical protein
MSDVDQRLKAAIQKKTLLEADLNRFRGRLESARHSLVEVEKECRQKNIEPSQLDTLIQRLEGVYAQRVGEMETQLLGIEKSLAPYMDGETS